MFLTLFLEIKTYIFGKHLIEFQRGKNMTIKTMLRK